MTIEINRSNNSDIDGILWGWAWGDGGPESLTFSFPTGTAEYVYEAINGFSAFNTAQETAVRRALDNIESFCNLRFTETTADGALLRYAEATSVNYTDDNGVAGNTGLHSIGTAEANPPELAFDGNPPYSPTFSQGDSWFNTSGYNNPLLGSFADAAGIMHETGHNLGLKHGHTTQDGHGVTFPTLPANHNSYEYSVMTYSQFPGDSTSDGDNAPHHPTTYMQNDIAALQYLYGANYGASAHNRNTVYEWSPTTGEASIDGIRQGAPLANYVLMTIWDGGGNDTYDLSNYTTNLSVNLNPGAWTILDTSAAQAQRANLGNTGGGPNYFARGNVANALTDPNNAAETTSLIENAVGGTGHDTLIGNNIRNAFWGNGGNDTLYGGYGNDQLNGGAGADTMNGGLHNDLYVVDNAGDRVVETSNSVLGGVDTVFSSVSHALGFGIEHLTLTAFAAINGMGNGNHNVIIGNNAKNILVGLGGNDTLNGNGGNDSLNGGSGNDRLNGGTGNDFLNGGSGNDVLNGEAGTDFLYGGSGADTLNGGSSNDTFAFDFVSESPAGAGRDSIVGFAGAGTATGDRIDLITIDANVLKSGNQAFIFGGPFTAGHLRYAGGVLSGNTDGDAAAEFQIQLTGASALVVGGAGTDILL